MSNGKETEAKIIPKGLHAGEHETGGIDEVDIAALAGISAELATHAGLPNAHHSIATGSYTGNDADGRQITVGFKCSRIITVADAVRHGQMIPNIAWDRVGTILVGGSQLHATDGFTIFQTGDGLNAGTVVYYYWAISE